MVSGDDVVALIAARKVIDQARLNLNIVMGRCDGWTLDANVFTLCWTMDGEGSTRRKILPGHSAGTSIRGARQIDPTVLAETSEVCIFSCDMLEPHRRSLVSA